MATTTTTNGTVHTSNNNNTTTKTKPIKIWVDGCFDMMHYGHANVLRQAKALGDYLVVGVHSDAEITANKGIPVTKEEERYAAVRACKWVDEVVPGAPFTTSLEVMDKYDCQYCVHGDDIVLCADGLDTYDAIKKANRFWMCKRTPGVSTTDIVGRMLLRTKEHHSNISGGASTTGRVMLPTSSRIVQFSNGPNCVPKPGQKVVYVDGAFDMLHQGHYEFLKKAKEGVNGGKDDFVIVGIHDDSCVNQHKGLNLPIMNLHERALSLLACRWVDEIIIGAPWAPTAELIKGASGYAIDAVCHGKTNIITSDEQNDPYAVAKEMGIYEEIDSGFPDISSNDLIDRIMMRREEYEKRNEKKKASMPEGVV